MPKPSPATGRKPAMAPCGSTTLTCGIRRSARPRAEAAGEAEHAGGAPAGSVECPPRGRSPDPLAREVIVALESGPGRLPAPRFAPARREVGARSWLMLALVGGALIQSHLGPAERGT